MFRKLIFIAQAMFLLSWASPAIAAMTHTLDIVLEDNLVVNTPFKIQVEAKTAEKTINTEDRSIVNIQLSDRETPLSINLINGVGSIDVLVAKKGWILVTVVNDSNSLLRAYKSVQIKRPQGGK